MSAHFQPPRASFSRKSQISHEVEDVAEIFARLNREGTRVTEADVTLALAAVHNRGWVREEYLPFCGDLEDRGWKLDAGIYIRTMTGIGRGRARLKEVPRTFWGPDNVPDVWKQARNTIFDLLKRLAEFGILAPDLLPSTNSLIPLSVLHWRWGARSDYSFRRALRWFLLANWDGRYSGSAITSLNEDVRAISEAESFAVALEKLTDRLRVSAVISGEDYLKRYDRAGNRFLRLLLYLMLFERGAPDWVDGARVGYDKTGSPITSGFSPQWHHIYPRSVLKKADKDDDEIHALSNMTVLNERTNANRVSGKHPARYIRQFSISEEVLKSHLIPSSFAEAATDNELLDQRWSVERYDDLLIERAELLATEATAFLDRLNQC